MDAMDWYVGLLKCCSRKVPDLATLESTRSPFIVIVLPQAMISMDACCALQVHQRLCRGCWVSQSALLPGILVSDPWPKGMQLNVASWNSTYMSHTVLYLVWDRFAHDDHNGYRAGNCSSSLLMYGRQPVGPSRTACTSGYLFAAKNQVVVHKM